MGDKDATRDSIVAPARMWVGGRLVAQVSLEWRLEAGEGCYRPYVEEGGYGRRHLVYAAFYAETEKLKLACEQRQRREEARFDPATYRGWTYRGAEAPRVSVANPEDEDLLYVDAASSLPAGFWDACPEFLQKLPPPRAADKAAYFKFAERFAPGVDAGEKPAISMLDGVGLALSQKQDECCDVFWAFDDVPKSDLDRHFAMAFASELEVLVEKPRQSAPARPRRI